MTETDRLKRYILGCEAYYKKAMADLKKGSEETKTKRQEQTGKPYQKR